MQARELEELRSAHNRRLERLKVVQSEQKLLKKQCAQLEEEMNG